MNPETELSREELAAEYVLGTLQGEEREAFEEAMADDDALRALVAGWEARLIPMSEFAPPKAPPPEVWRGIEQRLWSNEGPEEAKAPWWTALWDNLALWRGLGLAATAALLLAITLVMRPAAVPDAGIGALAEAVALIETPDGQADWVVTATPDTGRMLLKAVHHQHIGEGNQCRLYVADNGGHRAVAVMPEVGERTVTLDQTLVRDLLGKPLVISIEPNEAPFVTPTNPTPLKSRWVTF